MPKATDISQFTVQKQRQRPSELAPTPLEPTQSPKKMPAKLKKAGFLVTPEALQQFTILKAEQGKDDPKNIGPILIAEALNLLFKKYGKPPIA
jgi:hypothetical protein